MIESIDSRTTASNTDGAVIDAILERIEGCAKIISRGFARWDDPQARGPGLYFVIERESMTEFVDPMGSNRWPVEDCATVFTESDTFLETAQKVATSCDGAIVVRNDGTIEETMVRVKQLAPADSGRTADLPYSGWMGARHMSALETSTRKQVVATVTLSEEDGRVTVFTNGTYTDSLAGSSALD